MQIVIDIDDMAYKFVQDTSFVEDESTMFEQTNADRKKTLLLFDILDSIKNGTPLPKGHGRLIDESDLMPDSDYEDGTFYAVSIGQINLAPTIIEADEEESEENPKLHKSVMEDRTWKLK